MGEPAAPAAPALIEALRMEKDLGPDHPDVAVALNNLGDLYTKLGDFWQLGQGRSKDQALRQAQLATLEAYPRPELWRAFTLIGAG